MLHIPTADIPAGSATVSKATILELISDHSQVLPVANTTARAQLITDLGTAGKSPSATNPVLVYRADATVGLEVEVTEDGTNWRAIPSAGAWRTYTPALTGTGSNPALGSGAVAIGGYMDTGSLVHLKALIKFGTGASFGTGNYQISLPSDAQMSEILEDYDEMLGVAFYLDAGTAWSIGYATKVLPFAADRVSLIPLSGNAPVSPTVPHTWADTDAISISITYRRA